LEALRGAPAKISSKNIQIFCARIVASCIQHPFQKRRRHGDIAFLGGGFGISLAEEASDPALTTSIQIDPSNDSNDK